MVYIRWIISLSLLLSTVAVPLARAEPPQRISANVRFGGKVGLGLVTWSGKDADDDFLSTVNKIGLFIGVFTRINLNEILAFETGPLTLAAQPELAYAAKGAGIEIDGENAGEFRANYLTVALLPRVEYPIEGRPTPYAVIGPELGYLLEGEVENRIGTVTNIADDLTSTDFGLILGFGIVVPISSYGALELELRADLGLTSIDGDSDGDDIKNRAFSLMLGYQY